MAAGRETSVPLQGPVLHCRVVKGTGGGPEKTILNSCRHLEDLGCRAISAYLRDPLDAGFAELEARAERLGVDLQPIDDRGPFDWRIPGRIRQVLDRERPVIWHGHDYKSNLLGLILGRAYPMELVTTVHGWVQNTWKTPLYYAIDRQCIQRYQAVICVSEDLYRACLALGIDGERCRYVPNGIDVRQFQPAISRIDAKSQFGVDHDRLAIGAVGRLSQEKGFENLIHAFDRLLELGVDAELLIAGEGDLEPQLRKLASSLEGRDRIKILGYRSDTLELYQALDVFVLSSLREGLPNVLLEAMASQVPVLATRVAGVPSLIEDGRNGISVEPGSIQELLGGLVQLASDPVLRERLGRAGRRTVQAAYSFEHRMDSVLGIYHDVLTRKEGRIGAGTGQA